MWAPRRTEPVVTRLYRQAGPGQPMALLLHPGALPATVHGATAEALPDGVGLAVVDITALPTYRRLGPADQPEAATLAELIRPLRSEVDRLRGEAGDYVLAGWSFGGVVAHAIAAATAPDDRPRKLVLLDSVAATETYQRADDELDPGLLLSWFAMYLGARRGREVPVPDGALASRGTDEGLAVILSAAVSLGALAPDVSLPGLRKLYESYVDGLLHNNRLTATHQPRPTDVSTVLVKAERSLLPGDRDLGWSPLAAGGLTIRHCPGDHYTMLSRPDAVRVIADEIGKR